MEESPPAQNDPLNGACQLGKTQPSPFSSRKVMYENEEVVSFLLQYSAMQYNTIKTFG